MTRFRSWSKLSATVNRRVLPGGRGSTAALAALALLAAADGAAQDVRVDAPIPHARGQSVSPSFEGWYRNPDGTRSLVFGYFNRNYDERLDVPVGPGNRFEPGPPDRGQPTHFLPRRQTGVFAVVVPADFAGPLAWSLTAHGETISIPGHVRPEWEIDALREVTSGNTPPVVRFGSPAGEPGRGQYGARGSAQAVASQPAPIAVWAADDGVRKARAADRPSRFGLVWSKYRGPGAVTFDPVEPEVGAAGKAVTTVTFDTPGRYVLRVLAWDDSGRQAAIMAGGFFCCWTNGYVTVDVGDRE